MEPGTYRRNANGSLMLLKRVCEHPWGIGTYTIEGWGDPIYGLPFGADPHDFTPDRECVTPGELAAWKAARTACKCGR